MSETAFLAGKCALILEDEPVIAFALEDLLRDMGAAVIVACSVAEALAAIGHGTFSFAVLDVNIHGAKSYGVAQELTARGVPVLFATGYGDAEHPPQFAEARTLTKPYSGAQLAAALRGLV